MSVESVDATWVVLGGCGQGLMHVPNASMRAFARRPGKCGMSVPALGMAS